MATVVILREVPVAAPSPRVVIDLSVAEARALSTALRIARWNHTLVDLDSGENLDWLLTRVLVNL